LNPFSTFGAGSEAGAGFAMQKTESFAAGFPQSLGFLCPLGLKKRPLQNFHFATAPSFCAVGKE